MPQRSSDVVEQYSARALGAGIGALIALIVGIVVFLQGSAMVGLASVLFLASIGLTGYAVHQGLQTRKVSDHVVQCPYCQHKNHLTNAPEGDFTCAGCHRFVPVMDGLPMAVFQVRCGYCNALNYYSAKTEVLLCEDCNREIPISQADDGRPMKQIAFARRDDDQLYELVLIAHDGHHTEGLIDTLQKMLALNRNQVKQMLAELPVTLLTGIPRMKAEMLSHQLQQQGAAADFKPIQNR